MFNNASDIDASHSTFSEVHRDQYIYSNTQVQGNQTVNTIVHGDQIFQRSLGLDNLHRASVPGAAFDSIDRHPAPACLPGTRLELLARLADWIDDPNCGQTICWLSGLAGSGKSAIAQSIATKYASQRRLAASFFFSRKEILRRKAHGFFPTLACQILVFAPSIKQHLLDLLDTDAMIPTKILSEQARMLVQEPIASSVCSFPSSVLIVIDSLDECDDVKMASEIIYLLARILDHCRWPLKVLFTSRAESHIAQTFQNSELRSIVRSLQLQNFDVDDDIRTYLYHSFEEIRESMDAVSINSYPIPWPSEDEIETIVQRASGLFIFSTTVVKYVGTDVASPVSQLQTVLQAIRNGGSSESDLVYSSLDTLYSDTLCTIRDAEKVRLVLGLVVYAFRPLSIRGLNDLLWNSQFDASYTVKNLRSVLMISDSDIESGGTVYIYHTSFRDFLTSPHRSQQHFVDPVTFHSTLARACLELMIRHLKTDICDLGDPFVLNREVEDLDKRCKLHIKEGVRYACRWFAQHLSHVPWDEKLAENTLVLSIQSFVNRCLLNWIEVLSLTGELDSAVTSLREVVDWLKRSSQPYKETISLLHDAERLLLTYYDAIRQCALQVYYSLPCIPTHAQIRTIYTHELEDKFVVTHGLGEQWKLCLRSISTGASVKSVAISPSGRLIASAGETPGVQLWDMLTGSNTGHLLSNSTSTCPVIFSPSGDYIAVGYDTGVIDVWDVTTGQRLLDPSQVRPDTSVTVLAFSRSSLLIASGATDGTIQVWDVSLGCLKHSLAFHKESILCLLFSPNDDLIASGSDDPSIITSDVHSGKLVRNFQGHTSKVNTISFSSDGASIASGSDDQSVRLWDTRTAVCIQTFTGAHKKPVRRAWITADDKYIVSACNMDIYMWETSSPKRRSPSPQHIWSVNHYFKKMATMYPAWYSIIARFVTSKLFGRLAETDDGTILHTAPSPDGKTIGCAYSGLIVLLEYVPPQKSRSKVRNPLARLPTMEEPPMFTEIDEEYTSLAISLDKTLLVTSADNGSIEIWNSSSKRDWNTFRDAFKRMMEDFWPAPDGRSILVALMAGLQLFTPTGTLVKDLDTGGTIFGRDGAVQSSGSKYFAYWAEYTWNVDHSLSIHIYDASTGVRLKRIPGFFKITCVKFSAEDDFFACAHGDGIVQVWELPSVLCTTTIETGHGAITALEFLPGNVSLVVGSDKGCVEIRLVENGDAIHRVDSSPSKVVALAVPSGALIVVIGHADGSLFLWDPSCADVTPHRLSEPNVSVQTSGNDASSADDKDSDQDGFDLVKFTEGYQYLCTRSSSGVICTWNLTRCLAEYAERAKETPSDPPDSDLPVASDDSEVTSGVTTSKTTEPTPPDTPTASLTPQLECPHLVSRSESHIVYDKYFRSTYSIDNKEGWIYHGSKRMFWLPVDLRPKSSTALSAFDDRLVILTGLGQIVFFDLTPIAGTTPTKQLGRTGP